jgi:hypothetical protein
MRENFFFFFRELNRGKGKVEMCGSSKSDVVEFGEA